MMRLRISHWCKAQINGPIAKIKAQGLLLWFYNPNKGDICHEHTKA